MGSFPASICSIGYFIAEYGAWIAELCLAMCVSISSVLFKILRQVSQKINFINIGCMVSVM